MQHKKSQQMVKLKESLTCERNGLLVRFFFFFLINQFHATGLFQYPLKTSKTQTFSNVYKGIVREQRY